MNWNLEGLKVEGLYMGEIPVAGVVELSRVKYGGTVSHHLQLDAPVEVYGAIRDRVMLDHREVVRVLQNRNA